MLGISHTLAYQRPIWPRLGWRLSTQNTRSRYSPEGHPRTSDTNSPALRCRPNAKDPKRPPHPAQANQRKKNRDGRELPTLVKVPRSRPLRRRPRRRRRLLPAGDLPPLPPPVRRLLPTFSSAPVPLVTTTRALLTLRKRISNGMVHSLRFPMPNASNERTSSVSLKEVRGTMRGTRRPWRSTLSATTSPL